MFTYIFYISIVLSRYTFMFGVAETVAGGGGYTEHTITMV